MIIEILAIMVLAAAVCCFWPYIVDLFSRVLIPYIREKLGEQTAEMFTKLILFLDNKIVPVREIVVRCWKVFRERVVKITAIFTRTSAEKIEKKTEVYINTGEETLIRQTIVEEVSWHELPQEVRDNMIKNNIITAELDESKLVEEKFKQRCKEEGILIQEMR